MSDTKISALTTATTPLAGTEVLPVVQSGVTKKVSIADLTAGRAISASGGTFKSASAYGTVSIDNTGTTGGGGFAAKQNGITSGAFGVSGWIKGDTSSNFALFSETGKSIEVFTDGNATPIGSFTTGGNWSPASGKGIDFSAAGGTVLNDYETGTHIVSLTGSTSGTAAVPSTANRLAYTKIGDTVHVSGYIYVSSVSSLTGNLRISLPFTVADLTAGAGYSAASLRITNAVSANVADFIGGLVEATAYIEIALGNSITANPSAAEIKAGTQIWVSATYKTA